MNTQQSQSAYERQATPENQALILRDAIRERSVQRILDLIPETVSVPETPQRTVSPSMTNPIVQHALGQPTLEDEARRMLGEIHGADNDYQAAA